MNARQKAQQIFVKCRYTDTYATYPEIVTAEVYVDSLIKEIEQALQEAAKVEWPSREELMQACQEWGFDCLDGENCIEWLKSRLSQDKK
jgi:hypothetical protein